MTKGSISISIGILLVSFCMIEITTTTRYIGYGPLRTNVNPGCSPKHPQLCKTISINPYQRGCNAINHCRGENYFFDRDEKIISARMSF